MARPGPKLDPERITSIVADADLFGVKASAKHHQVSVDTVRRYRHRVESDPHLRELARQKKVITSNELQKERRRAIIAGIRVLTSKFEEMAPRDIVGALKILGELETISGALNDGIAPEPTEQDPSDAPADGGAAGNEAGPTPIALVG